MNNTVDIDYPPPDVARVMRATELRLLKIRWAVFPAAIGIAICVAAFVYMLTSA